MDEKKVIDEGNQELVRQFEELIEEGYSWAVGVSIGDRREQVYCKRRGQATEVVYGFYGTAAAVEYVTSLRKVISAIKKK